MKLQSLTGGQVDSFNMIGLNGICDEFKLFQIHNTAGHAQTQHTCLSASLCIASETTGNALISLGIHLTAVKFFCCLIKFLIVFFPVLWLDLPLLHKYLLLFVCKN